MHHHFILEQTQSRAVELAYIPTEDQMANIFTKALKMEKSEKFTKH